jgi:hypothetical protein
MGGIWSVATSSITTYLAYAPYAIMAAVAFGIGLALWARKNSSKGGAGAAAALSSGIGGVATRGGGGATLNIVNMMLIYSRVQRRIIGFRPFRVDRKTDPSGNILEKRAVYLDKKKGNGIMDRLNSLFANLGRFMGRNPQQMQQQEEEGILFTEGLAIGSPGNGWIAAITLEENAQIPLFPNESTSLNLAEEVKRINEQYDKRISRLKDAALSINQYASSANGLMAQALSKGLILLGICILVGLIAVGYEISQTGAVVQHALQVAAIMKNMTI